MSMKNNSFDVIMSMYYVEEMSNEVGKLTV